MVRTISPAAQALQLWVSAVKTRHPLRTWSLLITFFGDAVLPRQGIAPLAALCEVMAALGIEATAVRAAVSRLCRDGWLQRYKRGRESDYGLSPMGVSHSQQASQSIYARTPDTHIEGWLLASLADCATENKDTIRQHLRQQGFGVLEPNLLLRPERTGGNDIANTRPWPDVVYFRGHPINASSRLAKAWPLTALAEDMRWLLSVLPIAVMSDDPLRAVALRTLLIHEHRRLCLRDPLLPPELLPKDWPGWTLRQQVATQYQDLQAPSEHWLRAQAIGQDASPERFTAQ